MAITVAAPVASRRGGLYVALSLLMASIAVVGFWPRYFGPLVQGTLAQPPLLHVHAIVFTGWLALFGAQALLAVTRRVRWHMQLGRIGIAYGFVLVAVGLYTGVVRSAALPLGGEAERLLFVSIADMVVFAAFFGAAIVLRRRPQVHKRLMTVAGTTLLVAAVGRMDFFPPPPVGVLVRFAVWSLPILLAMAYDVAQQRRVHAAYALGLGAFVLRIWSVGVSSTPTWSAITRWAAGLGW